MSESPDEIERLADAIDAFLVRSRDKDRTEMISFLEERPDLREYLEPMFGAEPGEPEPSALPSRIGPYVIQSELGRGGMGIVYAAEHEQLGRTAAVKVLPELMSLSPRRITRFLREAKVAARLDHPGLARIHEVGEVAGTWWFAMDLVEGDTLRDRLQRAAELAVVDKDDSRLWVAGCDSRHEEAAELGIQLCEALAHAHAHGLVHRDVKPQNIMIDEVGRVRLVDFGLAKDLEDLTLTGTGDFMGTPHYSAPEQVNARADVDIDGRADLFSVGCVLYEVLTLRRPFDGRSTESILRAVISDEPKPPSSIDASVPKDLETIVSRALEKDPGQRYQSAGDMLEDLRRFRSGNPIATRPRSTWSKAWRWSRRHPGGALASLLAFGLFVVTPISAVVILEGKNVALAAQRDVALKNFEAANRAVDQLFTRIAESPLAGDVRLQSFRRALLEDARQFYVEFLVQADAVHEQGLKREVSLATARVAVVDYELGRYQDAAKGFGEALRRMAELPAGGYDPLDLADIHASRGLALAASGRAEVAPQEFEAAEALWGAEKDEARRFQAHAKWVRMKVARANRERALHPDRALLELEEALAMLDGLQSHGTPSVMMLLDRGMAQCYRASLLLARGQHDEAAKAMADVQAIYKTQPDLPRTRGLRSTAGMVRAQLLQRQGKAEAAERAYIDCLDELRLQMVPQPDNLSIRHDLVRATDLYSRFLVDRRRFDEGFKVASKVLGDAEELHRAGQGREVHQRLLLAILTTVATTATFGSYEDTAAIDEWFARAISMHRVLLANAPDDASLMGTLGGTLNNCAMRYVRRSPKDRPRAVVLLQEACQLQRQAMAKRPKERIHRVYLYNHLSILAPNLMVLGRPDDALEVLMEARGFYRGKVGNVIQTTAALLECSRRLSGEADKQRCIELALQDLEAASVANPAEVRALGEKRAFQALADQPRFRALTR